MNQKEGDKENTTTKRHRESMEEGEHLSISSTFTLLVPDLLLAQTSSVIKHFNSCYKC